VAVGDAAGAKGLSTYSDTLLVKDIDTALNQRGDDIAGTMTRLDTVEAAALGVPKFAVRRGTFSQQVGSDVWSQITGSALATPLINLGFTSWGQSALTIKRSGVYQVSAHVQFYGLPYRTVGVQVVKNNLGVDSQEGQIAKDEWGGPSTGNEARSATATGFEVVRLVAGDTLRLWVLQRNNNNATVEAGKWSGDLTMSVVWLDN
jgi:hypothetical protein